MPATQRATPSHGQAALLKSTQLQRTQTLQQLHLHRTTLHRQTVHTAVSTPATEKQTTPNQFFDDERSSHSTKDNPTQPSASAAGAPLHARNRVMLHKRCRYGQLPTAAPQQSATQQHCYRACHIHCYTQVAAAASAAQHQNRSSVAAGIVTERAHSKARADFRSTNMSRPAPELLQSIQTLQQLDVVLFTSPLAQQKQP
jgi:hypothetical protein